MIDFDPVIQCPRCMSDDIGEVLGPMIHATGRDSDGNRVSISWLYLKCYECKFKWSVDSEGNWEKE